MKNLEARLNEALAQVSSLKDSQTKQIQEQADAAEKIKKLNADLAQQKNEEDKSSTEKKSLQEELVSIQNLNHSLETGTFNGTEQEKQTAVAGTAQRATRMAQIRARLSVILQTEVKYQNNQAAIVRQIEFLQATIDAKKTGLESIHSQLTDPNSGLGAKIEKLKPEVAGATDVFLKAAAEAKDSEYVLSILAKRLSDLSKNRDNLFGAIKKEEQQAEFYKKQIADAQRALDQQSPNLNKEVSDLENMIASYKDVSNMGWFLETDCPARANFSKGAPGIYLSRAKLTPASQPQASTQNPAPRPVVNSSDAGKWGMYNMDFNNFRAVIRNGVLLSVPATVQLAVQQIVENYDFALTRQLDPTAPKCQEVDRTNVGNAMRVAAHVWSLGNDAQAKTRATACRASQLKNTELPIAGEFQNALNKIIAFDGSILDVALPKAGQSHPKDLIEREAIQNLARELAPSLDLHVGPQETAKF